MSLISASDRVRRFVFERHPVRGHWVSLDRAWRELRAHQRLPGPVRDLLGEAAAAATLLASTLKFEGVLTLQLQGDGLVPLLVAQCTHDFRIRAVARCDAQEAPQDFRALVGAGRIAVTVESEERAARYQGIVPAAGDSFGECFESYFATSEQLPTHVKLAAGGARAGGLIVQRLPASGGFATAASGATRPDEEARETLWREVGTAIERIEPDQLVTSDAETLLHGALGAHDVRLFRGHDVRFECRCSPTRVAGLLRVLGLEEVRGILAEQDAVTVTCEFCQRPYRFDAVDVAHLFSDGSATQGSPRLN
jgi:molecular chaperone Hsp33